MTGLMRLGLVVASLSVLGCEKFFQKEDKPQLSTAEKKASAGDVRAAINLYEAVLDGTPKSAEVHYRLAVLYDDKLKNSLAALHHFSRYLELAPNGPHAKESKAYKSEGELKLLTSLSKSSLLSQEEAVRIKNENLALRKSVVELRAQKAIPAAGALKGAEGTKKPVPAGARTHVVEPGETLASIAVKFYKNKARWKDIQDANFYSLEGTAKIKPGQELIIP